VSENILEQILFFHVSSFVPTLSDCHCKLEWEISANYCVSGELDVPIKTYDISPHFIWSRDSATEFQCALSSDQIQNCISKFNNIQIQQNQTSVDDAAAELSNMFISAATMSLKHRFKKITDKPKNKKWFDANLHNVRGNLLNYGKIYSKCPKDPVVKHHFYRLNREYSKLRKYKYKQYRQSNDGKAYTAHVKTITYSTKCLVNLY
jgi:hypothetical protein